MATQPLQILKKKTDQASKSRADRFGRSWLGELEPERAGVELRRAKKIIPSVLRKTPPLSWWEELYWGSPALPAQLSKLDKLPGRCSSLWKAPGHRWKVQQQFQHWWLGVQRLERKRLNLTSSSAALLQSQCFTSHPPAAASLQLLQRRFIQGQCKKTHQDPQFGSRNFGLFNCSQRRGFWITVACRHT